MNLKQTLFLAHYTDGDTKGNCERSMLKAGYKPGYARTNCGRYITASNGMRKAIEDKTKAIKILWKDGIAYVVTRLRTEMERTTSVSSLCLLVNAQKGYMDMQAKNEGNYGADNAQRTEKAELTEVEVSEAKRYAKWKLEQDLKEQKLGAEILSESTDSHRKDDNGI